MTRTVPYTWKVGVDSAFGYLTRPDGTHLAESRRFLSGIGLAVSLADGRALLTPADAQSTWQPLSPARACELAEIPAPAVDGAAETDRRLDPFHVERHTNPLFLTLVTLATERALPCGHALRAWLQGLWDGTFNGPFLEAPETFAASVLERITVTAAAPVDAVLSQIADDALLDGGSSEESRIARDSGWQAVIGEIPGRLTQFTGRLDRDRGAQQTADRACSDQLTLI
jgi:hypothetical protein